MLRLRCIISKMLGVMQEELMTWNLLIFTTASLVHWLTKIVITETISYRSRIKFRTSRKSDATYKIIIVLSHDPSQKNGR